MDYSQFVDAFRTRAQARLNDLRNTLISAGVQASRITGPTEPDLVDLRESISATRGGKTITVYIELTDSSHLGGTQEGKAIITLFATDGTNEITHTYNAGNILSYTDPAAIDALLVKLTELENACPALWVKIRAVLGV